MTPKEVAGETAGKKPLRILDPACGSGSFLIHAYQYLLDWHLQWYVENNPAKQKAVYQGEGGAWFLTGAEKKKILVNNIFGVDVDNQAVEVTKLNLMLKVLENENAETLEKQYQIFHERALPDLGNNIKCGNSLIGPDFYKFMAEQKAGAKQKSAKENKEQTLPFELSDDEKYNINAFDWEVEFPEIAKEKFDIIIGNPPYVRQETLGENFKKYAQIKFETYAGTADLYVYFIEKSLSLLNQDGLYSIIVANKWLRANYGDALRNFLKKKRIHEIIDFGELPVFEGAKTDTCIIRLSHEKPKDFEVVKQNKELMTSSGEALLIIVRKLKYKVAMVTLEKDGWSLCNETEAKLLDKLKRTGYTLGQYIDVKINYGIKTGLNEAFVIDEDMKTRLISSSPESAHLIKPFIKGDDIRKYVINYKGKYLLLIPNGFTNQHRGNKKPWDWFLENYPAIAHHLQLYQKQAEERWDKGDYWWELRACDYYDAFDKPKIIYPDIAKESRLTFDQTGIYFGNTAYFFNSDDKYLLGILNSKLVFYYYKFNAAVLGDANSGGRLRWFTQDVINIPIRAIDFTNPTDKAMHDQMISLVDRMLDLNKRLPDIKTPHEKTACEREITATDKQIDQLVYRLYDLTEEEIRIVEGE
jgi:hypothetical protein